MAEIEWFERIRIFKEEDGELPAVTLQIPHGDVCERVKITYAQAQALKRALCEAHWFFESRYEFPYEFPWERPYGGAIRGVAVVIDDDLYQLLQKCPYGTLRAQGASLAGMHGPVQVVDVFIDEQTKHPMLVVWGYAFPEKAEGARYPLARIDQGQIVI